MALIRPYLALALVATHIAAAGSAYLWGRHQANTACKLAATTQLLHDSTATSTANQAMQRAADQAAQESAAVRTRIVREFVPIEKEVIRYVQTAAAGVVCLDDYGLQLWRAANAGGIDAAGAEPGGDAGLRAAAAAGERPGGEPAGEPPAGGEGVPPVRGAAAGAGASRASGEAGAG
jgi:hypothetical protein